MRSLFEIRALAATIMLLLLLIISRGGYCCGGGGCSRLRSRLRIVLQMMTRYDRRTRLILAFSSRSGRRSGRRRHEIVVAQLEEVEIRV